MAAIDSLLRLIPAQRADALRLQPDAAPVLLIGESERPLSMPPLATPMLTAFIEEIQKGAGAGAGDAAAAASDGDQAFVHRVAGVGDLDVVVTRSGGTLREAIFRLVDGGEGAPAPPNAHPLLEGRAAEPAAAPFAEPAAAPFAEPAAAPTRAPADKEAAASSPPPGPGQQVAAAPGAQPRRGAAPDGAPLASPPALLQLLRRAVQQGASDLFLSAGRPATLRMRGALHASAEVIPTDAQIEALFGPHLGRAQRRRFEELGSVDLSYTIPAGAEGESLRYRVSLFRQEQGLAAAVRPVARRIPRLAELRLPPELGRLTEHRHGLVLMTGPTGSGKSTTLAALIAQLLSASPRHVITIEDPIEFRYPAGQGLVHQREVGAHVATFADGVRSALRSAPDVILVGEMRDPETISAALTAAETGHLVLSTLHCGTAGMAVDRIVDGFPQARQRQVRLQLSDVLRSVVSQRLLPGRAGGRVPALEILHVTHAVAALIREGRSHQIPSLIQTGRESGMVPLDRSLADLVRRGEITEATALGVAEDPAALRRLLG